MQRDRPEGPPPPDLHEEVARRLRRVCPDWPDDRFARLTDEVVRIVLKYDYGRDAAGRPLAGSEPQARE